MDSPEEHFAHTELERALKEQSYGLKSFEILKKTHLESTARVTILEGDVVIISLTPRGYLVKRNTIPVLHLDTHLLLQFLKETSEEEGLTYESIEEALQVVSPLYLQAKQRLLVERLSSIAFQSTEIRTE